MIDEAIETAVRKGLEYALWSISAGELSSHVDEWSDEAKARLAIWFIEGASVMAKEEIKERALELVYDVNVEDWDESTLRNCFAKALTGFDFHLFISDYVTSNKECA